MPTDGNSARRGLVDEGVSFIAPAFLIVLGCAWAVLLIRLRVNSAWLVLGGGVVGLLAARG